MNASPTAKTGKTLHARGKSVDNGLSLFRELEEVK